MEFAAGPPSWIEWEGIRWYRRSKGSGHYADRTGCLLHVAVWEREHGRTLPDGHVVHHIDHNVANNDPSNLELLTRSEHNRHHAKHTPRGFAAFTREERSEKTSRGWAEREPAERICVICGERFMAKTQRAIYCSGRCRGAAFRADHAERGDAPLPGRPCVVCGTLFVPRDRRKIYCGDICRDRAGGERRVARNRERLGTRSCKECGQSFIPKDGRQDYCSRTCRERNIRKERRAGWASGRL
jgi:hypothetical protein